MISAMLSSTNCISVCDFTKVTFMSTLMAEQRAEIWMPSDGRHGSSQTGPSQRKSPKSQTPFSMQRKTLWLRNDWAVNVNVG